MTHYEGTCDVCGEEISLDYDPNTEILDIGVDRDRHVFTWVRHIGGPKDECSLCSSRVYAEKETD